MEGEPLSNKRRYHDQESNKEFAPDKPGEFTFACGMNMMHGKIIVEPA